MAATQELLLRANDTLINDIQAAFKCGICQSTMKEPWVTPCNHPFCKSCLFACFGRTNRIECPMCRQSINKRGCGASEQIAQLVDCYLRLAGAFKSEIKNHVAAIPTERRFLESQVVTQAPVPFAPTPRPSVSRPFVVPISMKRPRNEDQLEPVVAKRVKEEGHTTNILAKASSKRSRIEVFFSLPDAEKRTPRKSLEADEEKKKQEDPVEERKTRRSGEDGAGAPTAVLQQGVLTKAKSRRTEDSVQKKQEDPETRRSGEDGAGTGVPAAILQQKPVVVEETSPTQKSKKKKEPVKADWTMQQLFPPLQVKKLSAVVEEKKKEVKMEVKEEVESEGDYGQGGTQPRLPIPEKTVPNPSPIDGVQKTASNTSLRDKQLMSWKREVEPLLAEEERPRWANHVRSQSMQSRILWPEKRKMEAETPRHRLFQADPSKVVAKCTTEAVSPKKTDAVTQSDAFLEVAEEDLKRIVEAKKAMNPGFSNIDALFSGFPGLHSFLKENLADLGAAFIPATPSPSQEKNATQESRSASTSVVEDSDGMATAITMEESKENTTMELTDGEEEDANVTINGDEEATMSRSAADTPAPLLLPRIKKPYGYMSPDDVGKMTIALSRTTKEDEALVEKFTATFPEIQMTEDVNAACTHLIMMNSDDDNVCTMRSMRFVYAVARGCDVIGRNWLKECLEVERILSTDDFAVRIGLEKDHDRFSRVSGTQPWKESRRLPRLFAGMKFYLPKSFSESKVVPREKIMELIRLCGGEVTRKIWELKPKNSFILFRCGSKDVMDAWRYEKDMPEVKVYTVDFVLDSIANYELPHCTKRYSVVDRPQNRLQKTPDLL